VRLDHLLSKEQLTPFSWGISRTGGVQCCPLRTLVWSGGRSWVECQRIVARYGNLPHRFEYARLRVGKSRSVGVFGSLAHCWVLRQQDIGHPCGGARWTLFRLSRARPKPYTLQG
jgi:hypothetical protein